MKRDKHTLDKILEECFVLFMQKGYKEATFPNIEDAIGMTRGAVSYYFKDKQGLFRAVIDKFVIEKQNIRNKIVIDDDPGLLRFIINYIDGINKTRGSLQSSHPSGSLFSYLNLINSALMYYDGFQEKAAYILQLDISLWESVIEAAKAKKEIKENVNVSLTAKKFQRLFYGQSFLNGIISDFNSPELLELYIDEYNLIKL